LQLVLTNLWGNHGKMLVGKGGLTLTECSSPKSPVRLKLVHSSDHVRSSKPKIIPETVAFDRKELSTILNVYGRQVAQGEWKDYAIDMLNDRAVFSIFKRASEMPIFRIEKDPKLRKKQGMYRVVGHAGQVLKRGHELHQVLRVLDGDIAAVR
jgi:hypothetical protein